MVEFNPNNQPDQEELRSLFVGKNVNELPTPMAILDRNLIAAHCDKMLAACKALDVKFRPHVKTHKTVEGTRLQLGQSPKSASVVVSTVSEAELLTPLLLHYKSQGIPISMLYSMPCPLSAAPRLAKLARALGPDGLSLMIDHPQQLAVLEHFITSSSPPPLIFVKVGKSRAGKAQDDPALLSLFDAVLSIHAKSGCVVHGLYTHDSSGSYSGSGPQDAMSYLIAELESAQKASELLLARPGTREKLGKRKIVLSVGATPNATSVQNLVLGADRTEAESTQGRRLRELLKDTEFTKVELHAGVYAILDMQQLRTQAVSAPVVGEASSNTDSLPRVEGTLAEKDVAFTVLAEVCSVYTARDTPQALINAGVLALGREPCRGYTGYGVVTDWSSESGASGSKSKVTGRSGWVVGKVSQEHGILIPEAEAGEEGGKGKGDVDTRGWVVGRKVRVVPNHACIAGAGFDFYAVVDGGDVVQDIWIRARGW